MIYSSQSQSTPTTITSTLDSVGIPCPAVGKFGCKCSNKKKIQL